MRADPAPGDARPRTALEVAVELLELGRLERRAFAEGRVEEIPRFGPRRAELLERLEQILPEGQPIDDEVRSILRQVHDEGRDAIALYGSLRDEIVSRLHAERDRMRAARAYENARAG